jgi:hypothetical protein
MTVDALVGEGLVAMATVDDVSDGLVVMATFDEVVARCATIAVDAARDAAISDI